MLIPDVESKSLLDVESEVPGLTSSRVAGKCCRHVQNSCPRFRQRNQRFDKQQGCYRLSFWGLDLPFAAPFISELPCGSICSAEATSFRRFLRCVECLIFLTGFGRNKFIRWHHHQAEMNFSAGPITAMQGPPCDAHLTHIPSTRVSVNVQQFLRNSGNIRQRSEMGPGRLHARRATR